MSNAQSEERSWSCAVVTDAGGFIGTHLVDGFEAHGCDVFVVDNFSIGQHEFITHQSKDQTFEIDIRDVDGLESIIFEIAPKIIFHEHVGSQ